MDKKIAEQMRNLKETIHRLKIQQSDSNSEVTKDYGYLKFDENDLGANIRLSQYIRLALQTDATTVVEFMKNGWRLSPPDLIISVTGGGKRCHMSAHIRKTFQRGLVAATATTNAWLITAGTNVGVVKLVGEAINNYRYKNRKHGLDVTCIGICTWDYIAGREQLENQAMESDMINDNTVNIRSRSSKYNRRQRMGSVQLDVTNENYVHSYAVRQSEAKRCDLEPNHTHFLIFDGKSVNDVSTLLQRANIEQYSRRINIKSSPADVLIPIVMILVEGGPFSIRTICQALRSNTPLVVVKGTGRAADLVAELSIFFSEVEIDESETEQRLGTQLSKNKNDYQLSRSGQTELDAIFERARANNNTWVDEVKDDLCQVLYQRKLVVVFEFDSPRHHGNLEDAILEALFKAAKFSGEFTDEQQCRMAELKLAMAWQNIGYTKKYLLTDRTISKWRVGNRPFSSAYGLWHIAQKLTLHDLEELYASADVDNGLPVGELSNEGLPTRTDYYSCYFPDQPDFNQKMLDKNSPLGQNATCELFLWAIFLDRFELAKYLCSKTWNQSVAPLVAARIYRQAIAMAIHSATKLRYENSAKQFDNCATSIIDRCFEHDETFAVELLKQPAVAFDNIEPLELAEEAECRAFIASECVQKFLDQTWYGHINYKRQAIHLRIFLCSLFFPLLPFFSVFLPFIRKRRQMIGSDKSQSKNKNAAPIPTMPSSDRDTTQEPVRWSEKIVYFYQAPIVRFCYHVIFFILFLGLFSYVLLIDFFPLHTYYKDHFYIPYLPLPTTEIVLHICTWSLIIEELRQFGLSEWDEYFSDMWNLIDVAAVLLYIIAFATRFIVQESFFTISNICLCLDLIVWFVRTLHFFSAFERLGPKLIMIFNTMRDLFFFICFILVFLCGFSITSWSLITSASQLQWNYGEDGKLVNVTVTVAGNNTWTWQILRDITQYGVWKVFGQVDPIVGTDTYSTMAFILAIVFVAIANILLLNVLIALFNVTIQNVQEQSHDLWRYQRLSIVKEFTLKTPLPPPFNILYYIFITIRFFVARFKIFWNRRRFIASEMLLNDVKTMNNNMQEQFKISDMMRRESAIAEDYWRDIFKQSKNDRIEVALQNIEEKIDQYLPYLEDHDRHTSIDAKSNKQTNVESDV